MCRVLLPTLSTFPVILSRSVATLAMAALHQYDEQNPPSAPNSLAKLAGTWENRSRYLGDQETISRIIVHKNGTFYSSGRTGNQFTEIGGTVVFPSEQSLVLNVSHAQSSDGLTTQSIVWHSCGASNYWFDGTDLLKLQSKYREGNPACGHTLTYHRMR